MKQYLILFCVVLSFSCLYAQPVIKSKKYPSLLWEITGKGMKRPSYLIGTMHVSNKMAFNLPDSFYFALRSAQVVALETNPETWQEDMDKYDISGDGYGDYKSLYSSYSSVPSDYLSINTLKFYRYNKKIERALYSNPSAMNNLLYRTYGNESSDFEEDTYLDMYIFQCGKKWGKKITGVEDYGGSMKLMAEAYKDAAKDKSKKERSYGDWDEAYSTGKLQEAYRRGDLDLLDTINKYNSFSSAFDEKFLYRRNEIQANSIDSILQSGAILFAGVGAAHLPGDRGVIEILRKKGYRMRPVKMGERASLEKELVDKIRVPVVFNTDSAEDGLFKVDIPGKFYKFGDDAALNQKQCADMANGSYYMVTRIMTNAWMWNHSTEDVYKVVDSLLYENVPGKIISKTAIVRNGYKGFDVVNRTRRGDLQRYNIFITPFEIIFFKMSGNGDYIKNGTEANKFFGSIRLREYRNGNSEGYQKFSPSYGGFAVDMPHEPYTGNDGSWIFDAADKANNIYYRLIRTDIHNFHFAGEDSFDLALMEESFMASDFIDKQIMRTLHNFKGYPVLDGKFKDKSGGFFYTRFIIQGPHYYTLIARAKQETIAAQHFLNSFEFKPLMYGKSKLRTDTALYYSVKTTWYPEEKKIKLNIPQYSWAVTGDDEEAEEKSESDLLESGTYRNKIISNDSTGEKLFVSFFRSSRYYYLKDSAAFEKDSRSSFFNDSTYVYRVKKKTDLQDKTKIWESVITDTASSRALRTKVIYKDGYGYTLAALSDTLTRPGSFIQQFFETFLPSDTVKGVNPFVKKSSLFFDDFNSTDSALHKRAVSNIADIYLDSTDLPLMKKAIASLGWEHKKYLETKKAFINKLADMPSMETANYLRQLYYALDDTVQLQYAVLENLLQLKTLNAYRIFRDIVRDDAPVLDFSETGYSYNDYGLTGSFLPGYNIKNGQFLDELSDSLKLTYTILPDLLPLLNLDDYKADIMKLLGRMADSNIVVAKDYETWFNKLLIEAKQELKKQTVAEKKKAIAKTEESKTDKKKPSYLGSADKDDGNADLSLYAKLLLPFIETSPGVKPVIEQMLKSGDKRLKYSTFIMLLEKGKTFPDSLVDYFAGLDEYRHELYSDLRLLKKDKLFPEKYNNHQDLGRSALLGMNLYDKPDSLILINRLPAEQKGKRGFIYFYKYKTKKDDLTWRLATVGLTPEGPNEFEFEPAGKKDKNTDTPWLINLNKGDYDFTRFTEIKLKEDEPVEKQLQKELRRMLYSRRNSGAEFYKYEDTSTEPEY